MNTENENGDDLGYGSKKKHIGRRVDTYADNPKKSGWKLEWNERTSKLDKNWQTEWSHERNRNDHIWRKEGATQKEQWRGETHFLMQVPTVSPCQHREGGDGWIEPAEMWRSLMESVVENIRDLSGTPSPSKNALAYCLQAIAETDKKSKSWNHT
jgi:hypothetical protein